MESPVTGAAAARNYPSQQVLGIRFFMGDVEQAVDVLARTGGVLAAPSGTCFARLQRDSNYRAAIVRADLAIPDSGAMVLLWNAFHTPKLTRISGLRYLRHLVSRMHQTSRRGLWIVPNETAGNKLFSWLKNHALGAEREDVYVAPWYGTTVEDARLVSRIEARRPDDVIIGIGSGPQEKLGPYLRDHLSYRPAIHCIGAALGFLTGDQIAIPDWADRLYLGWLLRLFAQPRVFIPRLTRALVLPWLLLRYGENLPPMKHEPEVGS